MTDGAHPEPDEALEALIETALERARRGQPQVVLVPRAGIPLTEEGDPGPRIEVEAAGWSLAVWIPALPADLGTWAPWIGLLRSQGADQRFELDAIDARGGLAAHSTAVAMLAEVGAQFADEEGTSALLPGLGAEPDPEEEEPPVRGPRPIGADRVLLWAGLGLSLAALLPIGAAALYHRWTARPAPPDWSEGARLRKAGRPDEAERHLRQVLAIEPGHVPAAVELGALLSQDLGRHADALRVYDAALDGAGDQPTGALHLNRANALLRLGRAREALQDYRQAELELPLHARVGRVQALLALEEREEAKLELQRLRGLGVTAPVLDALERELGAAEGSPARGEGR